MDAASLLRTARAQAGLSLRELADRAGTSHSTLSAYEQGRTTPRTDTLERICRAAGFALDWDLAPRPVGAARRARGQALLDVLALADAYPHRRTGPLDLPVFGRMTDAAPAGRRSTA